MTMFPKLSPVRQTVADSLIALDGNNGPFERVDAGSSERFSSTKNGKKLHIEFNGSPADPATRQADIDVTGPLNSKDSAAVQLSCERDEEDSICDNLSDPSLYLNRELSWLKFNERVLEEAGDLRTPLLERVKFLGIASSNLDEFYMKRIGGLKLLIGAGVTTLTVDGRTPREQLVACATAIAEFQHRKTEIYREVMSELAQAGVLIQRYADLPASDRDALRSRYRETILPLITPLAIDSAHPFPFISNLSLNLLVTLRHPVRNVPLLARVKIPIGAGTTRFVKLGEENRFVMIEDIMIENLDLLFPGLEVDHCDLFRVTRNANADSDRTEVDDLLEMIETDLWDRKFAPVVRLQTNEGMTPSLGIMLAAELELDLKEDVFETDIMVRMSDLMELADIDLPSLKDAPHYPFDNIAFNTRTSIFDCISDAGSILLQHPYESFANSVERFVHEASQDPQVVGIKMTLYRTSARTKIIDYLIDAARNGKQIAVVVELQARFDEAANIQWASRLEEAGIHVTYGVLGLKTHCKAILAVRTEDDGLRRYAHIGTGNYHAGTARLYSDCGLLTCDEHLCDDLSELFNYLTTGWSAARDYNRILVAPLQIKKALLDKIERESALHSEQSPGLIRLKTNALEDPDIVAALYRASKVGVKVELIVRDICRLRPGIPNLSETITVISVIGRFLEHARIYHFRNGGDEEFYIGSADLMTRNLERRVEIIAPVGDTTARQLLDEFLSRQLSDRRNVWEMNPDGSYSHRRPSEDIPALGCQEDAILATAQRIAQFPQFFEPGNWKQTSMRQHGAALSRRNRERNHG